MSVCRPQLCRIMITSSPNLNPQVAASLALWHEMVAQQDLGQAALDPAGRCGVPLTDGLQAVCERRGVNLILTTVVQVFKDFTYHRTLVSSDGLNVVLEFSATVGDKQLKGIDMIRFDEDGKIADFEVMVRPMSGLTGLGRRDGRTPGGLSAGLQSSIYSVRNPMQFETLAVSVDQHIATVKLNRPDKANAMNWQMWQDIRKRHAVGRPHAEVRVVIVEGEGKHFTSGIDLTMMMGLQAVRSRTIATAVRARSCAHWCWSCRTRSAASSAAASRCWLPSTTVAWAVGWT
jgi:hypothetical protein